MTTSFDVIVIGSGPGGYVCAIRAAQLGFTVACVEKSPTLGGTCLNIGCIPSKALLQSTEKFWDAVTHFPLHGLNIDAIKVDVAKMQSRKREVVTANVKGIEFLFKKHSVTWLAGEARILGSETVQVAGTDYSARNIVIASGSEVVSLPGVEIDEECIVSSTGGLELQSVPRRMIVIGGGYIGLELGSVWRRLGSDVTVIEYLDRLVPAMDRETGRAFERLLTKQGLTLRLKTRVVGAEKIAAGTAVIVKLVDGGPKETLSADIVLVAIGRRPYHAGLGIEEAGIAIDERKRIIVDHSYRTNIPGVFAIGDVIAGPMLAHKAQDEGSAVAEIIAGQSPHVNYSTIPSVVYTWPEVASVGATEEQLKEAGAAYKLGKFPFSANPRARAMGETEGFVKILADATTDQILGAHIIGPDAGSLIAEVVCAMEFEASSEDVARTSHAHPTLNEAVKEAALAVDGRAIHI